MNNNQNTSTTLEFPSLEIDSVVFVSKSEDIWNKPYTMKRHHIYGSRTVILQCKVLQVKGNEFKATLFGNNGFEKDGETFVFHKNELLCNQDFTDSPILGIWTQSV